MNGPLKMYRQKQIIRHDLPVELPNCMYKMRNILSTGHKSGEHVSMNKHLDISEQVNNFLKKFHTHPEMAALLARQEKILEQLADLKEQMLSIKTSLNLTNSCLKSNQSNHPKTKESTDATCVSNEIEKLRDLVINVSPNSPPYSLLVLRKLWKNTLKLVICTYVHSTVISLPEIAQNFVAQIENDEQDAKSVPEILIRLIWKEVDCNVELITSSSLSLPIWGETNLLRFLVRLGPKNWNYETFENPTAIDAVLDICDLLAQATTKTERHSLMQGLNEQLGKSLFLCGKDNITVADLAACSVLKQVTNAAEINVNLTKWLQRCELCN